MPRSAQSFLIKSDEMLLQDGFRHGYLRRFVPSPRLYKMVYRDDNEGL